MTFKWTLMFLGVVVLASGCSTVTMKQPLPSDPKGVDKAKFEGAWSAEDQIIHVMFASNGVARIAAVQWEDDQFQLSHGEMIVTEGEKRNFLSVRFKEDGKWHDEYFFASYKLSGDDNLVLWAPQPDAFEELVQQKKLKGTVEKGKHSISVKITSSPEAILKVLDGADNAKLFDYEDPMVLRRVSKEDK